MKLSAGALAVIGSLILPGAAQAQDFDCLAVMQAFRAEPVPGVAPPTHDICDDDQLIAFRVNLAAAERAVPVTGPAALYGTWLSDDALLYLSGITVPGTEVLEIGPGAEEGEIEIVQYWIKPNIPGYDIVPWEEDSGYDGWVSRGMFRPDGREGVYAPVSFGPGMLTYSGLRLEHERSHELFVLSQLNHFELPVTFLRDGDVLVLESDRRDPLSRNLTPVLSTYTRVDADAVDMALQLVVAAELSYGRFFDCFVHQLSDNEGPLIAAFTPYSTTDARDWVDSLWSASLERTALMAELRSDTPPENGSALMQEFMERYVALIETPINRHFVERLIGGADLGCPPVY
ncbi:hypothetical protein [Nioella sp.]|uniref:hypothetical protein n=1 Tax=Nioella sp. TaxID=1912091 RepID=UPI003B51BE73